MGFEDREYSQDASWQTSWGSDTPTTKRLLIITVLVFFAQALFTRPATTNEEVMKFQSTRVSYLDEWFMLDAPAALQGQAWRIVTYAFCHERQNPFSLVINMIGLWFLGRRLELMYGSREMLLFYLGSAIAGGAVFLGFGASMALPQPLSGAYPPVMALFTLYAMHFPREEILFFWLVPVQIRVLLIIYVGLDIYTVMRAMQGDVGWPTGAVTSAHLSGVAFGYLYKHFDWHLSGILNRFNLSKMRMAWRRRAAASRLRVYQPSVESEGLEGKVDAILAKIHEQGSESLTDAERAILARASERYKKKS